jgi:hypothetical protein
MNKNRRNVILQAPFGVGCVVMVASPSIVYWHCWRAATDASHGLAGIATEHFWRERCEGLPAPAGSPDICVPDAVIPGRASYLGASPE